MGKSTSMIGRRPSTFDTADDVPTTAPYVDRRPALDASTTRLGLIPSDAVVAASGKCIEGPPGMGFVIARRETLEASAGNCSSLALDLHDQWTYMERTTQWRYTPPTHVVVAFDAALEQFVAEGG